LSEQVFGRQYADQYDLLYQEKNYEAECDILEEMFERYGDGEIRNIIDLGCGTGGHMFPLAKRGYELTGVDQSPDMIAKAKHKLEKNKSIGDFHVPTFIEADIRTLDLGRSFDAALMMFAVLGYQLTNDDVLATLHTVRSHLKTGGIFLADIWYGPAVLKIGPSDRIKIIELDDGKLIRTTTADMQVHRHLCVVHYDVLHIREERLISHTQEDHAMRYFFPMELDHYFSLSGLELLGLHPFPNVAESVDTQTWNVLVCGRAIS
jgi:SAM-dependent methyltransferase